MVQQAYPREFFRQQGNYSQTPSYATPGFQPSNDSNLAFYALTLGIIVVAVFGGLVLIYMRKSG